MAVATTEPVRLPPRLRLPKTVQVVAFVVAKHRILGAAARRLGHPFTLDLPPVLGQTVVISDPALLKDVFSTSFDLIERTNDIVALSELLGPGSTFSLVGEEHLARRKLLSPALHGKRMRSYQHIIEEEVMREIADWPEGREFETVEPMLRLTLGSILRVVFGAEGAALDELRALMSPLMTLGSRLVMLPPVVRRDFGRWSPGGRLLRYRRRFDAVIASLIADARSDPAFEERSDVLAVLLRARDENGDPIPDRHIADELLTFVAAGHETTAAELAWTLERVRRHPQLLSRLRDEVDAGGSELRQATVLEALRIRPSIDGTVRLAKKRIRLGEWVIPEGTTLLIYNELTHTAEENFPDAASFDPERFVGVLPNPYMWIPFGGGVNRCPGASFAQMEIDIALRTMLREFDFAPTDTPGERRSYKGVAWTPARGGRVVVYRRTTKPSRDAAAVSVADSRSRHLGDR